MELLLWRHAVAEKARGGLADQECNLTPEGVRQSRKMAAWLKPRLPNKIRILVSPALRTRQTADALEMPYEIERKIGVGADVADMVAVSGWPTENVPVLLVTHQPVIGRFSSLLLSGSEANLAVKKAAVFWFSNREKENHMQVILRAAISPDLIL